MDMSVRARDLPDPPLDAAADRPDGSWSSSSSSTPWSSSVITASFFAQPLSELLHQNRLRPMLDLLRSIQSVHGIPHVDVQTGMELLATLRGKVEEDDRMKRRSARLRRLGDVYEAKKRKDGEKERNEAVESIRYTRSRVRNDVCGGGLLLRGGERGTVVGGRHRKRAGGDRVGRGIRGRTCHYATDTGHGSSGCPTEGTKGIYLCSAVDIVPVVVKMVNRMVRDRVVQQMPS